MTVSSELESAKLMFAGGSEDETLINSLSKVVSPSATNWLDVGAGNGRNLAKLVASLVPKGPFDVVSLDPQTSLHSKSSPNITSWTHHRVPLESFETMSKFDVIMCRQSLYYVKAWRFQLKRLISMLSSKGCLVVTVWTDDCVLAQLGRKIAISEQRSEPICFEDICKWAESEKLPFQPVRWESRKPLNLDKAGKTEIGALTTICARVAAKSESTTRSRYETAIDHLNSSPFLTRKNGSIIISAK